jgi:RNA polymerase sigma factor (sigma-70 family)
VWPSLCLIRKTGDYMEKPQKNGAEHIAVRDLFERYRAPLYAYFLRRTRNAADAEDLTHDVFVRLGRLDPATELHNAEAFIFQTAANLLRDRGRRAAAQRLVIESSSPIPDPPTGEPDPERVLGAKVELRRVMDALNTLSAKTRNIFILRRLEQMKCEEIAAFYGISVSAVEQHITKAMAHVAKTVKRP